MDAVYTKCKMVFYHLSFYCFTKTCHALDCQTGKKKEKNPKTGVTLVRNSKQHQLQ